MWQEILTFKKKVKLSFSYHMINEGAARKIKLQLIIALNSIDNQVEFQSIKQHKNRTSTSPNMLIKQ